MTHHYDAYEPLLTIYSHAHMNFPALFVRVVQPHPELWLSDEQSGSAGLNGQTCGLERLILILPWP